MPKAPVMRTATAMLLSLGATLIAAEAGGQSPKNPLEFISIDGAGTPDIQSKRRAPTERSKLPSRRSAEERYFRLSKNNYFHLGELMAPGYFTLVFFSSPTCVPCAEVRAAFPQALESLPSLVIVDIDIDSNNSIVGGDRDEQIMACFGTLSSNNEITLPSALLFDPFGISLLEPPGERWEIIRGQFGTYHLPPLQGLEIVHSLRNLAAEADPRLPINLDMRDPLKHLRGLESRAMHYAKSPFNSDSAPR